MTLHNRRILLIISGGIAAYKSLDLIRRLRERGAELRSILTAGAQQFVTPLSVAALSGQKVYSDLFSLTEESEMGHLRLAKEADLVLVAPATADLLAKMAMGLADDLATATLLATNRPVLVAPAMNTRMWENPATRANLALLEARGVRRVGPNAGPLAEGEVGLGRVAEPLEIVAAVEAVFVANARLGGRRALVTSGPTREAIDPVRYIANHSSGKQGHAIAAALARLGAETTLVAGPTREPDPPGVRVVHVVSAREMLSACEAALPADVAVCAAAVADWRVDTAAQKIKKQKGSTPSLTLVENPDILATLSNAGNRRPRLMVGFAAETENLIENAKAKRRKKGCDWILANDVAAGGAFGADANTIHLIDATGVEDWPPLSKRDVADRLAARVADFLAGKGAAE